MYLTQCLNFGRIRCENSVALVEVNVQKWPQKMSTGNNAPKRNFLLQINAIIFSLLSFRLRIFFFVFALFLATNTVCTKVLQWVQLCITFESILSNINFFFVHDNIGSKWNQNICKHCVLDKDVLWLIDKHFTIHKSENLL